jgi:hypothetical protein
MSAFEGTFDGAEYLHLHPDVAAANMDPWYHFEHHGHGENRAVAIRTAWGGVITGYFDEDGYKKAHGDLAANNWHESSWAHYQRHGHGEGRKIVVKANDAHSGTFDGSHYLSTHPDVAAAGVDAAEHFFNYGYSEGRKVTVHSTTGPQTGFWYESGYLGLNPDLLAAGAWSESAFEHFKRHGHGEGRLISVSTNPVAGTFDGDAYIKAYPDLAQAEVDPWTHYSTHGFGEKRLVPVRRSDGSLAYGYFSQDAYLHHHPDVKANWSEPAFEHYKRHGHGENRLIYL